MQSNYTTDPDVRATIPSFERRIYRLPLLGFLSPQQSIPSRLRASMHKPMKALSRCTLFVVPVLPINFAVVEAFSALPVLIVRCTVVY